MDISGSSAAILVESVYTNIPETTLRQVTVPRISVHVIPQLDFRANGNIAAGGFKQPAVSPMPEAVLH